VSGPTKGEQVDRRDGAGQSRLSTLAETCASIAIGFLVSLGINSVVLPAYGHHVTMADNLGMTAIFTVASVARGYLVRRWFNRMERKL
jgi:hypothetical protein